MRRTMRLLFLLLFRRGSILFGLLTTRLIVAAPPNRDVSKTLANPDPVKSRYMEVESLLQSTGGGPMIDLIRQYIHQHGTRQVMDQMIEDPRRRYIVAFYGCPHYFGNYIHGFTNAFAAAIALNRTLLWKYASRSRTADEHECDGYFSVRDWAISYNSAAPLLESMFGTANTTVDFATGCVDEKRKHSESGTDRNKYPMERKGLACCDPSLDSSRIIKIGLCYWHDMTIKLNDKSPFDSEARARLKVERVV